MMKLDTVMSALRGVNDPKFNKDVMASGLVKDLKIEKNVVSMKLYLKDPMQAVLEENIKNALIKSGAEDVHIKIEATYQTKSSNGVDRHGIPGVKNIIAVSSGKGGVGKSTVAANLAVSLAKNGAKVGLLDADIYGPNIPTMMGVGEPPMARTDAHGRELIIPQSNHGVKVMSMGLLSEGDTPVIWRGPMLHSIISQFLLQVDWGNLDYLVVDMPPGTGDVQLSLSQLVPVDGAVIVTTPQEVSAQDVRKAINMFDKVSVPVVGVVENMSFFVPEDMPEKRYHIFGKGAGEKLAEKFKTVMLAQIPIDPRICESGDTGAPISVTNPDHFISKLFLDLAKTVTHKVNAIREKGLNKSVEIGQF